MSTDTSRAPGAGKKEKSQDPSATSGTEIAGAGFETDDTDSTQSDAVDPMLGTRDPTVEEAPDTGTSGEMGAKSVTIRARKNKHAYTVTYR